MPPCPPSCLPFWSFFMHVYCPAGIKLPQVQPATSTVGRLIAQYIFLVFWHKWVLCWTCLVNIVLRYECSVRYLLMVCVLVGGILHSYGIPCASKLAFWLCKVYYLSRLLGLSSGKKLWIFVLGTLKGPFLVGALGLFPAFVLKNAVLQTLKEKLFYLDGLLRQILKC